jgi:hypothetical protein
MKKLLLLFLLPFVNCKLPVFSQSCSSLNITHQSDIASACSFMVMTMMHDELNRPYLYVANKEAGLKIYDISAIATPSLVATVPVTSLGSLHVMNLSQSGNYLYLALGNTFTGAQQGGMAIVDVANPLVPVVQDYYLVPGSTSGGGIVKVEGNYAYLGAMKSGLYILDVTAKNNIQFVSSFIPDINWPVNSPNANLYNARGMDVKSSIVYLCFDAGGIRIINCTNKLSPKETGRWCNPVMYSPLDHPKAYNNIVLDDTLAYIAVDYAGMEVLNVKDTSNMKLTGWWNPYNAPANNWFTSPSHANEIQLEKNCKRVFMSTGKSDMMVVDVTNPSVPDSCNFYGGVSNNIGTWGIGLWQNQIYLSYICTAGIPFTSNLTQVILLTFNSCTVGIEECKADGINVYPVPASCKITIELKDNSISSGVTIINTLGQTLHPIYKQAGNKTEVDISGLSSGCYFLKVNTPGIAITKKFVKE